MSFANAMKGRGFEWGTNDCNIVALKFLDMIMEGHKDYTSITNEIMGKYKTKNGAYNYYKKRVKAGLGGEDFLSVFCDKNPEIPLFQAGDIILVPMGGVMGAHVCLGGKSLSVDPELGAIVVPTLTLLRLENSEIYRPRL